MNNKRRIFGYYQYYFQNLYPMGLMVEKKSDEDDDLYIYAVNQAFQFNLKEHFKKNIRRGTMINKLSVKQKDSINDNISYEYILKEVIFYNSEEKTEYIFIIREISNFYKELRAKLHPEYCKQNLINKIKKKYPGSIFDVKFKEARNTKKTILVTISSNIPEGIQSHFLNEEEFLYFDIYGVSRIDENGEYIGFQNVMPDVTDRHKMVGRQKKIIKIEEEIKNLRAYNHTYKPIYSGMMENIRSLLDYYGNNPTLEYLLIQTKGLFLVAQIHQNYESFDLNEYIIENQDESGEYCSLLSFVIFLLLIQIIHRGALSNVVKEILRNGFKIPDNIDENIFEVLQKFDPYPYLDILSFAYEIKIPEEIKILIRSKKDFNQDIKYIGHLIIVFLGLIDNFIKHTTAFYSKRYLNMSTGSGGFSIRYFPNEMSFTEKVSSKFSAQSSERGLGILNFRNFLSVIGYELIIGHGLGEAESGIKLELYYQNIKRILSMQKLKIFSYEKI